MKEKTRTMLRWLLPAGLLLAGAVGGYLYYLFVGCASGTCAITSDPLVSTLYGGAMGGLLGLALSPMKHRRNEGDGNA